MKKKLLIASFIILVIAVLLNIYGKAIIAYNFSPQDNFKLQDAPTAPDYQLAENWAALPAMEDYADIVPDNSGAVNRQLGAKVDVFFIHPTSFILSSDWNAGLDNTMANLGVDYGILPQQASVYNGVARVYVPRYRQASLGAQMQQKMPEQKQLALNLAYTDVKSAFDYFLQHYNQGRPFIIASHSQGTTHGVPLLQYIYQHKPQVAKRMVAAYLIGNTVTQSSLASTLPICAKPQQTGCYLSWNAMLEGGDGHHWYKKGQPVCVNPLSWKQDNQAVTAEYNLGSIPLKGPLVVDAPHKNLTGAQCKDGLLWVQEPDVSGYTQILFPGKSLHMVDYGLFYMNIRENLINRVQSYFNQRGKVQSLSTAQ